MIQDLSFWYSRSLSAALQILVKCSDSSVLVMALISAVDIAVTWSISLSTSASSGCGSAIELRDSASGALFRVPFNQAAVNV